MPWPAYLTDGESALRRPVQLYLAPRELQILDEEGRCLDVWPLAGVRLAGEVFSGQPIRLSHSERGEARLTLESHEILEALGRYTPASRWRLRPTRNLIVVATGSLLVTVAVAALIVWGVPRLASPLARAVPASWEEAWGGQIADNFEAQFDRCEGGPGNAVLQSLAARMAAVASAPFDIRVVVIDVDQINAFALPGGRIFILRGLLTFAAGPEELAGVLAHEMAHVTARHPAAALIRGLGIQLILTVIAGDLAGSGVLADLGQTLLLLSYGRAAEREADRIGSEILRQVGLSPESQISLLGRMAGQEDAGSALPSFLSTHPDPRERIAALHREAQRPVNGTTPEPILSATQWAALQSICN